MKHVNGDRQKTRENDERTYSIESYGQSTDPLTDYHVQEKRLPNAVRTSYHDNDSGGRIIDETSSISSSRKVDLTSSSSALPPK